jgi:hypothetical protein
MLETTYNIELAFDLNSCVVTHNKSLDAQEDRKSTTQDTNSTISQSSSASPTLLSSPTVYNVTFQLTSLSLKFVADLRLDSENFIVSTNDSCAITWQVSHLAVDPPTSDAKLQFDFIDGLLHVITDLACVVIKVDHFESFLNKTNDKIERVSNATVVMPIPPADTYHMDSDFLVTVSFFLDLVGTYMNDLINIFTFSSGSISLSNITVSLPPSSSMRYINKGLLLSVVQL